jgi:hypothetical protein
MQMDSELGLSEYIKDLDRRARFHFEREAVPWSGDWKWTVKITLDGYFLDSAELGGNGWYDLSMGGERLAQVKMAIDAAWSKYLTEIMFDER